MGKQQEKPKQPSRYTDSELSIIKNTFAENEDLLKAIRKVFLQMPLDPVDLSILNSSFKGNKELHSLISKSFLPQLEPNCPRGQLMDLWVGFWNKFNLAAMTPDQAYPHLMAVELLIDYLGQQLDVFMDIVEGRELQPEEMRFSLFSELGDNTPLEAYVGVEVKNTLIGHIDFILTGFYNFAGKKDETVEQMKQRALRDSNK